MARLSTFFILVVLACMSIMDSRSYSLPKYTPTPNVQDVGQPLADFDQTTLQSDRYIPREWGQFSNRGEVYATIYSISRAVRCKAGWFTCTNKISTGKKNWKGEEVKSVQCVHPKEMCDGQFDCADKSDEGDLCKEGWVMKTGHCTDSKGKEAKQIDEGEFMTEHACYFFCKSKATYTGCSYNPGSMFCQPYNGDIRGTNGKTGIKCIFRADSWYKCYPWTKYDRKTMEEYGGTSLNNQRLVCESHENFIFSQGSESIAPGCGKCWCCQPDGWWSRLNGTENYSNYITYDIQLIPTF